MTSNLLARNIKSIALQVLGLLIRAPNGKELSPDEWQATAPSDSVRACVLFLWLLGHRPQSSRQTAGFLPLPSFQVVRQKPRKSKVVGIVENMLGVWASNKKLLVTGATLVVTGALLVVTRTALWHPKHSEGMRCL